MTLQIYDHLLRFQLFQGLSRGELQTLAGMAKFGFTKVAAGRTVASEGEPCQRLLMLIGGTITATTRSDDGGYSVSEQLQAPWVVQPEALFGLMPRYRSSYVATTDCHFISLEKDEVMRLADSFLILRLNLLNIISTLAQRRDRNLWRSAPTSLRQRFTRFLLDHCLYPAGPKELHILMARLAAELGDSRLDISNMLHAIADEGLINMHRGRITIPSLERIF